MLTTHTHVKKSFQKYFNGSGDSGYNADERLLQWGSKLDSKCGTSREGHTYTQGNSMRHVQQGKWFQGQCHCTLVIHQRHSSGCPAAQIQWSENKGETTAMASGVIRQILFSGWSIWCPLNWRVKVMFFWGLCNKMQRDFQVESTQKKKPLDENASRHGKLLLSQVKAQQDHDSKEN